MSSTTEQRPNIQDVRSSEELRRWYWLKTELVSYARQKELSTVGNKLELLQRLCHWLDTGEALKPASRSVTSRFDWAKETLHLETIITDNYRNTRNVRAFMKRHVGPRFAFSNEFMQWMRAHVGATLSDAVAFWETLDHKKRTQGYREASLPQNQHNQFSRALSQAKPGISAQDIRRIWALKRQGPAPHTYAPGDEDL